MKDGYFFLIKLADEKSVCGSDTENESVENISSDDEENEDKESNEANGIQCDTEANMDKSVTLFSSSDEEENDGIDEDIPSNDEDEQEQDDIDIDVDGPKNRKRIILLDDSDDDNTPESKKLNTPMSKGIMLCVYFKDVIEQISYF